LNAKITIWLEHYLQYGWYGLIVGVFLFAVSFFTNQIPDPSFPWANLPATLRLPIMQPRIEHWPISYTLAIWLWVFFLPVLFFRGYRRLGRSQSKGAEMWLVLLPVVAMIGWTTYCRFLWPKLQPASWNAPAYTFICWLYCSTYQAIWSNLAFAIAAFGVFSGFLAWRQHLKAPVLLMGFGILSLPLGLPVFIRGYRRWFQPGSRGR
jgi:hypothetical protein